MRPSSPRSTPRSSPSSGAVLPALRPEFRPTKLYPRSNAGSRSAARRVAKPVEFDAAALEELFEAASWFAEKREGLGAEFVAAVRAILPRIAAAPGSCVPVPDA